MSKLMKTGLCLVMAVILGVSLIACKGAGTTGETQQTQQTQQSTAAAATQTEPAKEPITIKYPTMRVGTSADAWIEKAVVKEFEEKYSDVKVDVEEFPNNQTYLDKMKVLAVSGDLPDIVEGKTGMLEILLKGNFAADLTEYVNADPQWKAELGEDAIRVNSRDGKLYTISNGGLLVGYFYNKEMFEKAGIIPAATWDEFMSNCEKLKAAGFVPLSLNTGENAWTTNLILGSIIGTSGDAGNEFMNSVHLKNFETPEFIEGLTKIKTMLEKYTTKDAIGAIYANAANSFEQGKTAMIANGPWMISDFSNKEKSMEGFLDKVGVAAYPGSGIYSTYEVGYAVCSKDKAHRDAAVNFLKIKSGAQNQIRLLETLNVMPLSSAVQIPADYIQKNPLIAKLIEEGNKAKYKYVFIDNLAYLNVIDSFKNLYPELAFNKITPQEMSKKLSEIAAKNKD